MPNDSCLIYGGVILKPIPFEDRFWAGSDGFIYSMFSKHGPRPRPLKLSVALDKDGYRKTDITRDKKKKTIRVANYVARAFHGLPKAGQEVRHKDGSKTNDIPSNLCWGTQLENAQDREAHGRTARGEKSGTAILTNHHVSVIKSRLLAGELQKHLAQEFGVHKTTIQAIAAERNWKWLQAHQ